MVELKKISEFCKDVFKMSFLTQYLFKKSFICENFKIFWKKIVKLLRMYQNRRGFENRRWFDTMYTSYFRKYE